MHAEPHVLKEGTLFQLGGTRFKVTRVELSPLDARGAAGGAGAEGDDDDDPTWAQPRSPAKESKKERENPKKE